MLTIDRESKRFPVAAVSGRGEYARTEVVVNPNGLKLYRDENTLTNLFPRRVQYILPGFEGQLPMKGWIDL